MTGKRTDRARPVIGMTLAFTPAADATLAGIPAKVVYVWPRFRSGDYLVTLEYAEAVKFGREFIQHIDAFMSELEPLSLPQPAYPMLHAWSSPTWLGAAFSSMLHIYDACLGKMNTWARQTLPPVLGGRASW